MVRTTTIASLVAGASAKVYFSEKFSDLSKWTPSTWKGTEMAEFESKLPSVTKDDKEDLSMATTKDARFYGASSTFEPFSNEGKTLIVQYQVKQDTDVECGGGYLKMGPKMDDQSKFGDPTKYYIMFGPDKCGYTKRTHLIFSKNGKNVLKKTDLPYKQEKVNHSVLYRLTVTPDSKVKVEIDEEEVYSGELEKDWDLLEPKEISDPDDKKPSDWVDDAMMDDPEDKKPADWVEEKQIVDKDAKQPDDWDVEEDGEWEAPMKDNPDYKGEWKAKRIPNPAYKGIWEPKKIANPKYVADDALYKYEDFAFVGFDLWQVKSGTFFDNIIITDDVKEADKFKELWKTLSEYEKEQASITTTTTAAPESSSDSTKDVEPDEDKDDDEDL